MATAQIIGIDNALNFLRKYKGIEKIEVLTKSADKVPFAVFDDAGEFADFFADQADQGNLYALYYVRVTINGKNAIGFTFSIETKKQEARAVNGPSPAFEKINELYLEVGELRAENKRLLNLCNDLEQEIADLEREAAEISGTPDPLEKVRPYVELAKELQPLIHGFFNRQPIAVNGPGQTDLNSLVAEMQTLDPDFLANFEKLVRLARTKPEVYQIAIQYLNQL